MEKVKREFLVEGLGPMPLRLFLCAVESATNHRLEALLFDLAE